MALLFEQPYRPQPSSRLRVARSLNPGIWFHAGALPFEYVAEALPTTQSGIILPTINGLSLDYSGTAVTQFANKPSYSTAGPMTVAALIDCDALTNYGAIASCQTTATTDGWEFRIGQGATDGKFIFHRASGTEYKQYAASAGANLISGGQTNYFAAAIHYGGTLNAGVDFFLEDSFFTGSSVAGGVGTTNATTSTGDLYIGRRYDGATQLDGRVHWFAMFPWALNYGQLQALRRNAHGIMHGPRRIWVPVSTGGATYTLSTLDAGSYTQTGNSATLTVARKLTLDAGSYTLTGNSATLAVSRKLTTDAGSYTLTGNSATLSRSYPLSLDAGSYAITGNSADLTYAAGPTYTLDLLPGSYTLAGNSATLTASRAMTLDAGSYAITGNSATLSVGVAGSGATAEEIWSYVLSNGLTAGETLAQALSYARRCCG